MAAVSTRYAQALLDSAKDKKQSEEFKDKLQILADLYRNNAEFKETIISPKITNQLKAEIINDIINPDKVFGKFMELLLNENRIILIEDIYEKYIQMIDKINKKINIQIITAVKIDKKDAEAIAEKYKKLYQANDVSYETKVDKEIMGGVKVIVGDKVYDDTIATKLSAIFEN